MCDLLVSFALLLWGRTSSGKLQEHQQLRCFVSPLNARSYLDWNASNFVCIIAWLCRKVKSRLPMTIDTRKQHGISKVLELARWHCTDKSGFEIFCLHVKAYMPVFAPL